jgi:hypothetical protein
MIVDAPWKVPNTAIQRDFQTPRVKEEICRYSSQYSARLSAHPNGLVVNLMEQLKPHGTTTQQATAKTTVKWSAYQIPSVVVFVVLVCKVKFVILIPKMPQEPIGYRGALLSTLLHAIVYVSTQFVECTGTDWK